MKKMRNNRVIHLVCVILFSAFMFACSDDGDDSPSPGPTVEPTLTSLWNNLFTGCGVNCHTSTASDGTELGPDLSTKANFYNNLVNKSVDTDYPAWGLSPTKLSNCNSMNFITPNNATESTLAAALIQSISDTLSAPPFNCVTAYNLHDVNNQAISDNTLKNALITWINNGAQNN
jgi:hypothetical protein